MSRPCPLCQHPDREQIDQELAAGASPTKIGRHYGASRNAMRNHRDNHLGDLLARALRGDYQGDISGIRSLTITTWEPAGDAEK